MASKKLKYVDEKGSRYNRVRPVSVIKKRRIQNQYEMEQESASTSASARKLKITKDTDIEVDAQFSYRILNFLTVFGAISQAVKCKKCDSDVTFSEKSVRGLGFKLVMKCNSCEPTCVDSSPLINGKAYDINRRIVFVFRLLGMGLTSLEKFCGLMDLPRPVFQSMYDKIGENILCAAQTVAELSMKNGIEEEKKLNEEKGNGPGLTVSGDGTWQKRGFSSLFGVNSLIGHYSGKVVDIETKSAYCKQCETWEKLSASPEYAVWKESHKDNCQANHEGPSGNMEVSTVKEMFMRSEEKYSVMYSNYIGDGDSKTFKALRDSDPYHGTSITKKECVGHIQKRMGTRLRNVKNKNKGLGGKGKLTDKLIKELTIYYGLAIRRNANNKDNMKNAIWATFLHKISNNENPQHQFCDDSWCSWRQAKLNNSLDTYIHFTPLPQIVQDAIFVQCTRTSVPTIC